MERKSQLKSNLISKVWLNRKDYKFLDFDFKVTDIDNTRYIYDTFDICVYNYGKLILKIKVEEEKQNKSDERFMFEIIYFNPQTDNDCYSINHIIAVCSDYFLQNHKHEDKGNAEVINNRFIFRKKDSYYSYVKIWTKGDIREDNYDKQLSYEFATDEYIQYIKKIFKVKKIPRRKIKKNFKGYLDKIILLSKL